MGKTKDTAYGARDRNGNQMFKKHVENLQISVAPNAMELFENSNYGKRPFRRNGEPIKAFDIYPAMLKFSMTKPIGFVWKAPHISEGTFQTLLKNPLTAWIPKTSNKRQGRTDFNSYMQELIYIGSYIDISGQSPTAVKVIPNKFDMSEDALQMKIECLLVVEHHLSRSLAAAISVDVIDVINEAGILK